VSQGPTYRGHMPALDGLRGVAIAVVMAFHYYLFDHHVFPLHWFHQLTRSGWLGVDLFFVLSGFLITGILIDQREKGPSRAVVLPDLLRAADAPHLSALLRDALPRVRCAGLDAALPRADLRHARDRAARALVLRRQLGELGARHAGLRLGLVRGEPLLVARGRGAVLSRVAGDRVGALDAHAVSALARDRPGELRGQGRDRSRR
jgi:hypothetical protein